MKARSMKLRRRASRPAPSVLAPAGDTSPRRRIDDSLRAATGPQAAYPLPPAPSDATRAALGELVDHAGQQDPPDPFRVPAYAPAIAPPPPPTAPQPVISDGIAYVGHGPGPIRITGELPAFAEALQVRAKETEAGHDALPCPIWCTACGTDFTDGETGQFDRAFQYLHGRATEAGWLVVRPGEFCCPACLTRPPVSMLNCTPGACPAAPAHIPPHPNLPVLAGGLAAEVDLMIDVNARSPELHPGYDVYLSNNPGRHGRRSGAPA